MPPGWRLPHLVLQPLPPLRLVAMRWRCGLGLFAYKTGLTLMVPAVAMGIIALICALAWMFRALKRNQGEGRRIGLIAA